jgi:hypothetical protein
MLDATIVPPHAVADKATAGARRVARLSHGR